jgi:DNA-binding LacI/PurR family transcriptional regulator
MRIEEIANRMDYHPNLIAKNLVSGKTMSVLFISDLSKGTGFHNPHVFEILCGCEHELEKRGYQLSIRHANSSNILVLLRETWQSHRVDCFIVHASSIDKASSKWLGENRIPHVIIGEPYFKTKASWIDVDNKRLAFEATIKVLEQDCKSICFIGGRIGDMISQHRFEGFKDAIKTVDGQIKWESHHIDSRIEDAETLMLHLLKKNDHIDCIITANNTLALGIQQAFAKEDKLRIIKMMTCDDYPYAKSILVNVSYVSHNMYALGRAAARIATENISNRSRVIQERIGILEVKIT